MTTLFLNITHGFQARMLLRSRVADRLLESGARLVVCSPNADEPYFREEFDHPQVVLEPMPTQTTHWENRLATWRQYLLMNPSLGATLNYKRETLRRESPKRFYVTRAANLLLGNIPSLRRLYMRGETRLFPAREFDRIMEKWQPDLVVTGTPGFNTHDVHALRSAKRLGIPSATVMLSWDNLTSKGYMNGVPDHLLVWSSLMAAEAVEYHDFPAERTQWTGAAQFDVYHGFREGFDEAKWRAEHQVPADAFLVMYGTINPRICPHELTILKELLRLLRGRDWGRPTYLWIRLHPQMVQGPWKQVLEPLLEMESSDVCVEVPPVHESTLPWDLPQGDATHLASLLTAADLVVTTSSTLSIDAACVDTPIANVFFDGLEVPKGVSVERFRHYTHYAKILSTGGIAEAMSPEEMEAIILRYMEDPGLDAKGRAQIVAQQLGRFDGEAGERTAMALLKLAGQPGAARATPQEGVCHVGE